MAEVDDFICKFHNLEGFRLKEKKKSLHSLLASYKNANPQTLESIVQKLTTSTYLEETYRIEFLIYFKRSDDLLKFLWNGNEIEACKIIRQNWFIKQLMEKYTPERFVCELFPQFSVSIRTKILKKVLIFVKDEVKIQQLFEKLYARYGWKVAEILLPGCNEEKIREVLNENHRLLSSTKLKQLYDKNPQLISFYFKLLKNDEQTVDHYRWRSFFNYVIIKDPLFFSDIAKEYDIYRRNFGRQSTKKFVDAKRDEIIDNPNKFGIFLKNDVLVRKLGKDFPIFFKNGLPNDISDFNFCIVKSLLKYYTKKNQYDLYFKSFEEKYNKNLWDNTKYMEERLIEVISDKKEREKWIEKFDNHANYLKYQPEKMVAMSLRLDFEEDLQFSDEIGIADRKTIFSTLICTCKMNQDYEALLNILKFFCQRHRNSDVTILYNFLSTIHTELDMKKLTEEHWKYINEIITVQLFKKQQLYFPIFLEYIKFVHYQKKPINDLVLCLMKELPKSLVDFKYDDNDFEKIMLQLYLKLLPFVDDKKNSLTVQITLSVMKWNMKYPTDLISVHDQEHILKRFTKLKDAENVDQQMMEAFIYLICRQKDSCEISSFDQIYWENFKNLNNKVINKWFLKYKPDVLKNQLDKIGIMMKDKNINFIRTLKKYDHADIPNSITKLCLIELENAKPSKRECVIRILSYFMPQVDFLDFLKKYVPKMKTIDVSGGDEDTRKTYEIQCALAKHFKCRTNIEEGLQYLLKYCGGDILDSALPSLYSSFYRIPEKKLYSVLDELNKEAVSVRKHSIFLSVVILPVENVVAKYKSVQKTENHISVLQQMFLSCYKYFLQNSVAECWPILQKYIAQIKKEQKNALQLLVNVRKIPRSYRAVFTECVWEQLYKFKKDGEIIDENTGNLLDNLKRGDIVLLRKEFCENIIQNMLFDLENCSLVDSVFNFTRRFILNGDDIEEKLQLIFNSLHNFKEKFWAGDKKTDALKVINNFCFEILRDLMEEDTGKFNEKFSRLYSEAWKKEFNLEETFEEHLFIDFVIIKFRSGTNSDSFAKEINKIFSEVLEKYGSLIIDNFKNFLSSFLRLMVKNEDYNLNVLKFLYNFLEFDSSLEHYALAVDFLPMGSHNKEGQVIYNELFAKLLQKDKIIKMRLYGKLKNSSGYYY